MTKVIYIPTKRTYLILGVLFFIFSSITLWLYLSKYTDKAWYDKMYSPGIEGKLVIIDPGHGGADPGAIVNDIQEAKVNLDLARELKKELEGMGAEVILTREETGELVPEERMNHYEWIKNLEGRKEFAVKKRGHIFISLHGNTSKSQKTSGAIVFYTELNSYSKELAEQMQNELNLFWDANREVQEKGLSVICLDKIPSILIEVGFLTNDDNRALIISKAGQKQIAQVISRGIEKYCDGLTMKEE